VTKLNSTGSALVYSTFLGGGIGGATDSGRGIAVDALGNAYVTGITRADDFPTTAGAFQPVFGGGGAFVAKFNPAALGQQSLVYSTFLGAKGVDGGSGIAVDADGEAYVTGFTSSADFPTTAEAFQPVFGGGDDAFVAKLDSNGAELVFSSYLGGSGIDGGSGIALDPRGNAYVTGRTHTGTADNDFPTTAGAFQTTFGGIADAFVAKIRRDPRNDHPHGQ